MTGILYSIAFSLEYDTLACRFYSKYTKIIPYRCDFTICKYITKKGRTLLLFLILLMWLNHSEKFIKLFLCDPDLYCFFFLVVEFFGHILG